MGFDPPPWQALCEGVRPRALEPDEMEPGIVRRVATRSSVRVERHFRQVVLFERMGSRDKGFWCWVGIDCVTDHVDDEDSATLLQDHFAPSPPLPIAVLSAHVPVWPSSRFVWPPLCIMHQNRGIGSARFVESAAARVCLEAGACVTTNVLVQDLDCFSQAADSRRLEVVDGLPIFGGSQLALDTMLVCASHCDGSPHTGAADTDGVVLQRAWRRKERRYPELVGRGSRARLVVLAIEVGGRWSLELQTSVAQLAKSKAREQPLLQHKRFEQAWRMRWEAFFACAAAKAVATCLLDLRCAHGADGHTTTAWEVEAGDRHMRLAP